MNYLINSHEYSRMQVNEYSNVDDSMPYSKFLEWNAKCIAELSEEDRKFLDEVIQRIDKNKINILDLEFCTSREATNIYFDMKKKLNIVCPR